MKLLIVIVNYNSADLTVDCLRSLDAQRSSAPSFKVIVTDNRSPDDSLPRLKEAVAEHSWEQWVEIKPLPQNGGFAYGNNAAIRAALNGSEQFDFVLLLNPDTIVLPNALQHLVDFMENHPNVGIAGSRLEDPDGTAQCSAFRFHSIAGEFERGIRLGFVSRLLADRKVVPPVPQAEQPCDWVAGASMIIRRQIFEKVGLIDEKYFMYFEEVDFCRSAKRAGWECWYVPQSRVIHLVGSVSQISDNRKHRKRRPKYWFESRRRYFVKNHGWFYAALADLAFVLGFTLWRIRRVIQRKVDTDPPKLLMDSISQSVFVHGTR